MGPPNPVAIVGIGNTDYGKDYADRQAVRNAVDLASTALARALEDCGLSARQVNGMATSPMIPGSEGLTCETIAQRFGMTLKWTSKGTQLSDAVEAIRTGRCDVVAIVYGSAQRSRSITYGGPKGRTSYQSYYYYHPWGFSSQAAHWALLFRRHQLLYGSTEEQLGAVPVALRKHASLNPDAIMRTSMDTTGYLASRYVCRPLRLLDLCLVNDGGVVLILAREELARTLQRPPVWVAGWSSAVAGLDASQFRPLVIDMLHEVVQSSSSAALEMAGVQLADIAHFQAYDASSVLLPIALEGAGFCGEGEGLQFVQDGRIEIGGALPCNTSGGLLSESYMHGQNLIVEAVRQLRHSAGPRQVPRAEASMYVALTTTSASTLVFTTEAAR